MSCDVKKHLIPPAQMSCHTLLENLEKYVVWEHTEQAWDNTVEAWKFVDNDYLREKASVASTI